MFPRHRSKVPVRETSDTGSGIISLVEQESFKIVHRHRFEDVREVDRFIPLEDLSQFRRHHRFSFTRIAWRKRGPRSLRSPSQGLRKQILHVAESLFFNLLRVCFVLPYVLQLPVRPSNLNLLPERIVCHTG